MRACGRAPRCATDHVPVRRRLFNLDFHLAVIADVKVPPRRSLRLQARRRAHLQSTRSTRCHLSARGRDDDVHVHAPLPRSCAEGVAAGLRGRTLVRRRRRT